MTETPQSKADARQRKLLRAEQLAAEMSVLIDRLDEVSDQLTRELRHGVK